MAILQRYQYIYCFFSFKLLIIFKIEPSFRCNSMSNFLSSHPITFIENFPSPSVEVILLSTRLSWKDESNLYTTYLTCPSLINSDFGSSDTFQTTHSISFHSDFPAL